jgi:hypothetical protein
MTIVLLEISNAFLKFLVVLVAKIQFVPKTLQSQPNVSRRNSRIARTQESVADSWITEVLLKAFRMLLIPS